MKRKSPTQRDEMRPEYDFDYAHAVRGKYFRLLLQEGANVVVLEPDIARAFRSSKAVNDALRALIQGAKHTGDPVKHSSRGPKTVRG